MSQNGNTKKGKLYGIGIGPGDPDLLTLKAVKILEQADVVCVPKSKEQASTALSIVQKHLSDDVKMETIEFSMSRDLEKRVESRQQNAKTIEEMLSVGKVVVFLTLGDPMLYSTYSYILEYLNPEYPVETIPGIYSFSAISGLLSLPLCKGDEKLAVLSSFDEQSKAIFKSADTVVCMKVSAYYSELHDFLASDKSYEFVMITDAGKTDQKVYNSISILENKVPYFSTAIIQRSNNISSSIKIKEVCQA